MVESGELSDTGAKPKLPTTIPNLTDKMLNVYSIPLKYLYYNDENGRISTQIKREYGDLEAHSDENGTDYNDKISKFIVEDNPTALKKTKKSIEEKGQQVYGYVLEDGRVIDGNRRFTALRQLEKEIGSTWNFEAVILPFTYDAKVDRSKIKRLELAIQLGTEERLSYDPVDLAVDVYNTVIKDELMTVKDYSNETNIATKEVKAKIATVEMMHEFLIFINAPEDAYYIIKDLKLYNPLYELAKKLSKNFPDKGPNYEQTKETMFAFLGKIVHSGGDTVREVRDYMKNIVNSGANDNYNNLVEETVDDFRDKLEEAPIESATEYRKRIENATPELRKMNEIYVTTTNHQNRNKNIDNFINEIREITNTLEDIKNSGGLTESLHFSNFTKDQVTDVREHLIQINLISEDLIEVYGDEL